MKSDKEGLNTNDNTRSGWWSVFVKESKEIRLRILKMIREVKNRKSNFTNQNRCETKIGN